MVILQKETETENEKFPVENCCHVDVKDGNQFHWSVKDRFYINLPGRFRALAAGR